MSSCLNTYIWDWNMVARLDPDYMRYLTVAKPVEYVPQPTNTTPDTTSGDGTSDNEVIELMTAKTEEILIDNEDDWDNVVLEGDVTEYVPRAPRNLKLYLREEYANQPRGPIPTVPLLMPPKTVLAHGSKIVDMDYKSVYSIEHSKYEGKVDHHITTLVKEHFYVNEDHVGISRIVYWFDRLKNVTSEVKHSNRFVTYNLKTAKLYKIAYEEAKGDFGCKRKKYTRKVRAIGLLNDTTISMELMSYTKCMVYKFSEYISNYVSKIVPDKLNYDIDYQDSLNPPNKMVIEVFGRDNKSLYGQLMYDIAQHRVGKRIEWLKETNFIKQLIALSNRQTGHTVFNERMYKAMQILKRDISPIRIIKTLFKKDYKDLYYKLLRFYSIINTVGDSIVEIMRLINKDELPKNVYHALSEAVNARKIDKVKVLLSLIGNLRWDKDKVEMISSYLKLINTLPEPIDYFIFRDTLSMAKDINLRVRISKFKSKEDVKLLHDKLSNILNRNRTNFEEYEKFVFLHINSPTKEYGGFRFVQLQTTEELIEEGTNMHHCVGGYSRQCLEGSLIFSMRKDGRSWATLQLSGIDYTIIQKYTVSDTHITNGDILNAIETWRTDLEKMNPPVKYDDTDQAVTYEAHASRYYSYQKIVHKLKSINNEIVNAILSNILICDVSNYESLRHAHTQLMSLEEENALCLDAQIKQFVE